VEYSLFNAADDFFTHITEDGVFGESLLLNVLFQESILLHEAYFLGSGLLARHVAQASRGVPSLFELACRRGLIVPAFRDVKVAALEQAYEVLKKTYGHASDVVHPQMQPFVDRIIASVDLGLTTTKPFYWPKRTYTSGDGYLNVIKELLQTEDPPQYIHSNPDRDQLIQRVWEASKVWRFDLVEEAIQRTMKKGHAGLQRTELFTMLGRSVGVPEKVVTIGPEEILERCVEPEQKLAMQIFMKWISQCHHLNQARYFGVAINFPAYNIDEDFIVDTLLRSPLDSPPRETEGFRCMVELPPLNALLRADATELIAIRADLGPGYLFALRRWQNDPSDDNRESVKRSLRDYSDQICARYNIGIRQAIIADIFRHSASPWGEVVRTATSIGGTVTGVPLGVFTQFTSSVVALYKYRRVRKVTVRLSPKTREIEVTLASSLQA
jgi:hypothetical protein